MRVGSQRSAILFVSTITVSSFLLFQVQPLVARFALPWFGGAPGVWTVCMLFFQTLLLAGYAYAHWLNRALRPKSQFSVHAALLVGSLFLLPLIPSDVWKIQQIANPTVHILAFLLTLVGLHYFLLASTAPLIQTWYARRYPNRSPYRLYAWSNTSSLVALLSYPFFFEPALSLDVQAYLWSGLYLVFLLLCIAAGFAFLRNTRMENEASSTTSKGIPSPDNRGRPVSVRLLWFSLPFCASVLLLAITNELCHDVAVVPFLWVAPLSLYLLSFILTFESSRWYKRVAWVPLAGILLYSIRYTAWFSEEALLSVDVGLWCAILFVFCMLCHGEVAKLKPEALQLTSFYLTIASGGAAGGLFVALFAPRVFRSYAELPVGLCLSVALIGLLLMRDPLTRALKKLQLERSFPARIVPMASYVVLVAYTGWDVSSSIDVAGGLIAKDRNFYGVLQVRDEKQEDSHWIRYLEHGRIIHGAQYRDPERETVPLTYYGPESGFGVVIRHYPKKVGRHIGAIGLGAGSIAGLTRKGDTLRFYEINPQVVQLRSGALQLSGAEPGEDRDDPGRCEDFAGSRTDPGLRCSGHRRLQWGRSSGSSFYPRGLCAVSTASGSRGHGPDPHFESIFRPCSPGVGSCRPLQDVCRHLFDGRRRARAVRCRLGNINDSGRLVQAAEDPGWIGVSGSRCGAHPLV